MSIKTFSFFVYRILSNYQRSVDNYLFFVQNNKAFAILQSGTGADALKRSLVGICQKVLRRIGLIL